MTNTKISTTRCSRPCQATNARKSAIVKTVLVVSPHFPPVNAADMHRVRISLAHFSSFGWNPVVLAVAPDCAETVTEPLLTKTLPQGVPVHRVSALPARVTRKIGLGNLGLRAFPFLYREGCRIIRKHRVDLVYFSTTMFPTLPLGRFWKRKFGVPFVIDMQDPWLSEYHANRPEAAKPPKYWAAARMHRVLEPWTMQATSGLIAVSAGYIDTLQRRYARLASVPAAVLPFGAAESDFEVVRANPQPNRFFQRDDGLIHGVYVGRGGADMAFALRILFSALKRGLQEKPELYSKVRLHFVGTDYAPADRARKTVEPVAQEFGLLGHVYEYPLRIPYFEGLQLLLDSQFLVVPGSDDPQYTASKIFPYILARKPLLGLFNQNSSVCHIVRSTGSGKILAFDSRRRADSYCPDFYRMWTDTLSRLPFDPQTDWRAFETYTAREMARKQSELFDEVLKQ